MKSFCKHLQFETCWSPSTVLPPGGPISTRVVVEDAWLAAWQERPQLMKASIHLNSHNIHARERLPQRKQAPFKEKTISPPQQIPANLPALGEVGEERCEWWTPARLQQNLCACVCICVCMPCGMGASYSIRLSVDTSPMHPVLVFHSSTFQHPLPLNTALSHLTPHTSSSKINVFSPRIYLFYIIFF